MKEFGKILSLHTPKEPMYAVTVDYENGKGVLEFCVSEVDYLAICEDGNVHMVAFEEGYCEILDAYEYFDGVYNAKRLRD